MNTLRRRFIAQYKRLRLFKGTMKGGLLSKYYRSAVVTGARSGIGLAIAQMLLLEGLQVWGTSRNVSGLDKKIGLPFFELDLLDAGSILAFTRKVESEVGLPDIFINNAGYGVFSPFEEFPRAHIEGQLRALLEGPITLCRHFYGPMCERGSGVIVNVSSLAGEFPMPFMSLYNAAKAGLSSFSRTLMLENRIKGVNIIDFQPGDIRTPFNQAMEKLGINLCLEKRVSRVWEQIEAHLKEAPLPDEAAKKLRDLLILRRSGTFTTGSIFQAHLGPFLARCFPRDWVMSFLRAYYRL